MKKLAMFNHKGGVGKTTLTINIADAIADHGLTVLVVDADPQCNLSAFYIAESELDELLGESSANERDNAVSDASSDVDEDGGSTIWTAIRPVVRGRGDVDPIAPYSVRDRVFLAVGDVLLSLYEEELPGAWTDSFARKTRGYDVVSALPRLVDLISDAHDVDIVIYDVGPNVGPLNRTVLLDSDYFITPVAPDLFSLRALTTVGQAMARWIEDWSTVRAIASKSEQQRLSLGEPAFLGYVTSAYKVGSGGQATEPHGRWDRRIAPRVRSKIVDPMTRAGAHLVCPPPYKLGEVKHFQSLAAAAQQEGQPFRALRGKVNPGYNDQIDGATEIFASLAERILERMEAHANS